MDTYILISYLKYTQSLYFLSQNHLSVLKKRLFLGNRPTLDKDITFTEGSKKPTSFSSIILLVILEGLVSREVQDLGLRDWGAVPQDRNDWKRVQMNTKVHNGLKSVRTRR